MDLIKIIFAILLPPLGVFMQVGFAGAFWLNILLTLCGYIPGIVHAVWIIAKRSECREDACVGQASAAMWERACSRLHHRVNPDGPRGMHREQARSHSF